MRNLYVNTKIEKYMDENKTINTILKTVGLTNYESQCYRGLLTQNTMTAQELSKITTVPRTKLYESLHRLSDMEFIDRIEGRPVRFIAKSPANVLGIKRDEQTRQFDFVINSLQETWNNREEINYELLQLYQSSFDQISNLIRSN